MPVPRIARDPPGVNGRDSPENQRELRLGHRGRPRHEGDIAHGSVAAERDIKQRGGDSAGENPTLHSAAAGVRNVEDGLIEQVLRRESRRREEKLLVWMKAAVYSGKDGRPAVVETDMRVSPDCVRHEDMTQLVGDDAAGEAEREKAPVVILFPG